MLGPVLFILYLADLIALIEEHSLSPHHYADDTQICGSCSPLHIEEFSSIVSGCVNDVVVWTPSNRLKLNPDGVLWCASSRRQHRLSTDTLTIGQSMQTKGQWVLDHSSVKLVNKCE